MEVKKNYIIVVLLVVIIAISGYMLFTRIIDYKETINSITLEKESIEELNNRLFRLRELEKKADELTALLENYKRMIPETPEESTIITNLTDIARIRGIDMNRIQFEQEKTGEKLVQIPVKLNLTGGYFDFTALLDDIYNSYRMMNIYDISLRRADGVTGDIIIDMSLEAFHKK